MEQHQFFCNFYTGVIEVKDVDGNPELTGSCNRSLDGKPFKMDGKLAQVSTFMLPMAPI